MCIITNDKHIVVSVSLIPGLGTILSNYHVYFPYTENLPKERDYFLPELGEESVNIQ